MQDSESSGLRFDGDDEAGGAVVGIVLLAVILGLIPANIAKNKGRNFFEWWVFGAALFIVALPMALMMQPDEGAIASETGRRKCPFCAELIKREAIVCRFCGRDVPSTAPVAMEPGEAETLAERIASTAFALSGEQADVEAAAAQLRDMAGGDSSILKVAYDICARQMPITAAFRRGANRPLTYIHAAADSRRHLL